MIYLRILLVLAALGLAGCGSSGGFLPEEQRPPTIGPDSKPQYLLGSGDVVSVSVWKNPDLSVSGVPVRPDGYISVPLVGDVLAGKRTPDAIARDIEQKLLQFIRTPKVSLIVEQINSDEFKNRVRVVGGVSEPKSISYREGMTVLDLILDAGGVNEFASPEGSKLYRTIGSDTKIYPVFLESILKDGVLDTNYGLYPGDVISVPERRF